MLRKLIATFYKKGMSVVSLDTLNQVFSIFVHNLTSSNKNYIKESKNKAEMDFFIQTYNNKSFWCLGHYTLHTLFNWFFINILYNFTNLILNPWFFYLFLHLSSIWGLLLFPSRPNFLWSRTLIYTFTSFRLRYGGRGRGGIKRWRVLKSRSQELVRSTSMIWNGLSFYFSLLIWRGGGGLFIPMRYLHVLFLLW